MFEDTTLIGRLNDKDKAEVRIDLDGTTQNIVMQYFSKLCMGFFEEKEATKFCGSYSAGKEELNYIDGFPLSENIKNEIDNPTCEVQYKPLGNDSRLKYILCGEKQADGDYIVAFQLIKWDQYIHRRGINLYYDKDTFSNDSKFGFTISDELTCVYKEGKLYFRSFWYAKQIFDLSAYYREATAGDIKSFVSDYYLQTANVSALVINSDSVVRRHIASIIDSGILEKYSANDIKNKAKKVMKQDIISVSNGKIILPEDIKIVKVIVMFMDKGIYEDPITGEPYQTNSTKKFLI